MFVSQRAHGPQKKLIHIRYSVPWILTLPDPSSLVRLPRAPWKEFLQECVRLSEYYLRSFNNCWAILVGADADKHDAVMPYTHHVGLFPESIGSDHHVHHWIAIWDVPKLTGTPSDAKTAPPSDAKFPRPAATHRPSRSSWSAQRMSQLCDEVSWCPCLVA